MTMAVGRGARRWHLLAVGGLAFAGLAVIVLLGLGFISPEPYERDLTVLAALVSAPMWILGLIAAVELINSSRGRTLSFRRALVWALVAIAVGLIGSRLNGLADVVLALLTGSETVGLDGLTLVLSSPNSARFLDVGSPWFWMPAIALLFGACSLVALAFDRRATRQTATALGGVVEP